MSGTIEIAMTGRRPVRIKEAEWPVVGGQAGDDCKISDPARYEQAISQRDADTWEITVREHEDGRCLVYGTYEERLMGSAHAGPCVAGVLVLPGGDVAGAVRDVGETLGVPGWFVPVVLGTLPAEEL